MSLFEKTYKDYEEENDLLLHKLKIKTIEFKKKYKFNYTQVNLTFLS